MWSFGRSKREDIRDIKYRLAAIEEHVGALTVSTGQLNKRMDRFDERLTRVETRLGLHEAEH